MISLEELFSYFIVVYTIKCNINIFKHNIMLKIKKI